MQTTRAITADGHVAEECTTSTRFARKGASHLLQHAVAAGTPPPLTNTHSVSPCTLCRDETVLRITACPHSLTWECARCTPPNTACGAAHRCLLSLHPRTTVLVTSPALSIDTRVAIEPFYTAQTLRETLKRKWGNPVALATSDGIYVPDSHLDFSSTIAAHLV